MFGRILTRAKGFFPPGYKYVTGKMSINECNNNQNIIPLTLKTRIVKSADTAGFNVKAGQTVLLDVSYVSGSWINNQSASVHVDFLSAFNFDFKKMIAECKPISVNVSSIYTGDITSWLEKIGGGY